MRTVNEYANAALDAAYSQTAARMLAQIKTMSQGRDSAMQVALRELETEANTIVAQSQEPNAPTTRMDATNAHLEKAMRTLGTVFTAAGALIAANSGNIEESGQKVAIPAVTAKVFAGLSNPIIKKGGDPVSPSALAGYVKVLADQGADWNAPPDALDFAKKFVETEEWRTRIESWAPGYLDLINQTILDGIAQGWGPKQIASKMRQLAEGMPLSAAENLMRTLQLTSYREASLAMEMLNGGYIIEKVRIATLDERTCLSCIALHGTILQKGERIDDHYRGRAELPGSVILSTDPTALKTLRYDGDVIVIHAASGKLLTVTPYHPVLTRRGWIAAKFVKVGDDVISDSEGERTALRMYPDKKHVPTLVENVASSFDMMRLGSVPKTAKDFYRKTADGDVDVVFINRLLWNNFNPAQRERIRQDLFGYRSGVSAFLSGLRHFARHFAGQRPTSQTINGFLYNRFSLELAHANIAEAVGFRHGTRLNPIPQECLSDYRPGNSYALRDGVLAHSTKEQVENRRATVDDNFVVGADGHFPRLDFSTFGFTPEQPLSLEVLAERLKISVRSVGGNDNIISSQITLDPVIEVGVRSFSGHVYSLQTKEEWYYSNGIISHNCSEFYRVPGGDLWPSFMQADSKAGQRNYVPWQTGEDWFNSLSLDRQARQASFLQSPAKLRAYLDGNPLSAFVGEHVDPVFGQQIIEASLISALGDIMAQMYKVK